MAGHAVVVQTGGGLRNVECDHQMMRETGILTIKTSLDARWIEEKETFMTLVAVVGVVLGGEMTPPIVVALGRGDLVAMAKPTTTTSSAALPVESLELAIVEG